jgi:RNA polymerase sigma-70 factor
MDQTEKLADEARKGSREAFSQILRLYQGRVRIFIRRFVLDRDTADDLSQETFLAAFRDLKTLPADAPFELWLLGIARNRALKHLRDVSRRRAHESPSLEAALAGWCARSVESGESGPSHSEKDAAALQACLGKLPEHSAGLVNAYYYERLNAAQIARRLGKTDVAVRVTLLRIRESLGKCMRLRLASSEVSS